MSKKINAVGQSGESVVSDAFQKLTANCEFLAWLIGMTMKCFLVAKIPLRTG